MVTSRPPGCKIASESEPQDAVKHVIFTLHGLPKPSNLFIARLDMRFLHANRANLLPNSSSDQDYPPRNMMMTSVSSLLVTLNDSSDGSLLFHAMRHELVLLNSMPLLSGCLDPLYIY